MNAYEGARRRRRVVVAVAVIAVISLLTPSTLSGFRQSSSGVSRVGSHIAARPAAGDEPLKVSFDASGSRAHHAALSPQSASAAPGEPTRTTVRDVSAAVSGTSIVVTGTATFVEFPQYVGEDPADDSMVPWPGADVVWAAIEHEPGSDALTFSLGLNDSPPTGGALGYVYNWPLGVDDQNTGVMLQASVGMADCVTGDARPGPVFRLVEHGYDEVATLQGSFAANRITFDDVPLDLIEATEGSRITTSGQPVVSTAGVAGCAYYPNSMGDFIAVGPYTVPEMTVRVSIAPAGSPGSHGSLATVTPAVKNGEPFSVALPKPQAVGEYHVIVEACYGVGRCDAEQTAVFVPSASD